MSVNPENITITHVRETLLSSPAWAAAAQSHLEAAAAAGEENSCSLALGKASSGISTSSNLALSSILEQASLLIHAAPRPLETEPTTCMRVQLTASTQPQILSSRHQLGFPLPTSFFLHHHSHSLEVYLQHLFPDLTPPPRS